MRKKDKAKIWAKTKVQETIQDFRETKEIINRRNKDLIKNLRGTVKMGSKRDSQKESI
jgi:hypothetical protein